MTQQPWAIEATYDRVAQPYAAALFDELSRKPFDRQLLDDFAARVRRPGTVCDLGCGPGQIAQYLKDRGVTVCGLDLSAAMVAQATRLNPDILFYKGDMRTLNFPSASFVGIAAFYSIIHLHRHEVSAVLQELHRVLQPDALLLLAFYGGEGEIHADRWFNQVVSTGATRFTANEMTGYLLEAGFQVDQTIERGPYDFEYQEHRVYILGSKGSPVKDACEG